MGPSRTCGAGRKSQCHLVFRRRGIGHKWWGGPSGPRGTPRPALFSRRISVLKSSECRPGGWLQTRASAALFRQMGGIGKTKWHWDGILRPSGTGPLQGFIPSVAHRDMTIACQCSFAATLGSPAKKMGQKSCGPELGISGPCTQRVAVGGDSPPGMLSVLI
jgi:hypothetical protein